MSLIRVSMGVFPTNRTKKSCSMTDDETVRREGKRSRSFPNLLGWLGYWLLTYSSKAHWDFSCRPSTWATSDSPQASARGEKEQTGRRQSDERLPPRGLTSRLSHLISINLRDSKSLFCHEQIRLSSDCYRLWMQHCRVSMIMADSSR